MKQYINPDGYYLVGLSINNKQFLFYIQRLVAELYIPNPNNLPEVDHKDTDKSNNHMLNLEWVTHKENVDRATENGLMKHSENTKLKMSINSFGKNNPNSKLTEEHVKWIRKNYIARHKEFSSKPLSRKFNVSIGCINGIIHNRTWKHLD